MRLGTTHGVVEVEVEMIWRRAALVGVALCTALGVAYVLAPDAVLRFPNWFWNLRQPWWWPYKAQANSYPASSLLAGLAGTALACAVAALADRLSLRRAAVVLVTACLLVQLALLLASGRGLRPYPTRLSRIGQSEFFMRAGLHPQLLDTLRHYEERVKDGQPSTFSRNKGPANLGFYIVLHRLAQTAPLRPALDGALAGDDDLAATLASALHTKWRGRFKGFDDATGRAVVRTFTLMPLVTTLLRALLPLAVLLLAWPLFERPLALLLGALSVFLPTVRFEHVRLDGSLYTLLFVAILGCYLMTRRQRPVPAIAAGGLASLYLYFTFGALPAVAACGLVAGFELVALLWQRAPGYPRSTPTAAVQLDSSGGSASRWGDLRTHVVSVLLPLGLFAGALLVGLLLLRGLLAYHVLDRYLDARSLQHNWRGDTANWRWMILNGVEFAVTLGPVLWSLAAIGVVASVVALLQRRARGAHLVSLAVLGTFALVDGFGANSEVHRLWAFFGAAFLIPAAVALLELQLAARPWQRAAWIAGLAAWLALQSTHFSMYGMVT